MDNSKESITLIIDTREQQPLAFPQQVKTERHRLISGDYSIKGFERQFAVERKSLEDLVGTVIHQRERFEYELLRLSNYEFRRVIVEATFKDVAQVERYTFCGANPKSVIHTVYAFECRYNVPFVFAGNRQAASDMVCKWAWFYQREKIQPKAW